MDIAYSENAKEFFYYETNAILLTSKNVSVALCPNCKQCKKYGGFWFSCLQFAESLF
jgi:NMD protein affecting ribosome stability and mRNA decay